MGVDSRAIQRPVILRDQRYPGGTARLLAWDCEMWLGDELSSFLCRAGDSFILLRSHAQFDETQMTYVDIDAARDAYDRLRVRVAGVADAFPERVADLALSAV